MNAIEKLTIKLAEMTLADECSEQDVQDLRMLLIAARQAPQASADPPEWPAELASNCIYNNCPHPKHCREQNRCTATEKHHDKPDGAPELAAKHADDARTQEMAAELVAVSLDIPLVRAREFLKVNCAWPDGRWYRAARHVAGKPAPAADDARAKARNALQDLPSSPHAEAMRSAFPTTAAKYERAVAVLREIAQ